MSHVLSGFHDTLVEFIRTHQVWTGPTLFVLAFAESFAFVSLFVPAWALILGAGALSEAGAIPFWPAMVGAALGATAGDWVSYLIGSVFRERVGRIWPFASHPERLQRARAFTRRWGTLGIFVGRFFGPLRATVPLAAGILDFPYWPFQFANIFSALVWSAVLLNAGGLGLSSWVWLIGG
jgi:membrane protein DedA with SNARE-associated domain